MKTYRKKLNSDAAFGYSMVAPAVILFLLFVIYPFSKGIWISFHQWDGIGDMKWIGLNNYFFVADDNVFWKALKNTIIYAIAAPLFKNIVGLALALLFVTKLRGMYLFRVSTYIPYTFGYVMVGVLWIWVYNPSFGLLNQALELFNLQFLIQGWLSDPNIALFSIIAVDVWKCMGFHAILYLAGLNAIPQELYEAADIDGANGFQKFRSVTIPQLNSTIVMSFLLATTGAFVNNYDVVKIMTAGGPFHSTEVVLTHIMTTAFNFNSAGKANAMSIILVVFVALIGFIQLKVMTKDKNYE
jgi:raffinose/stachyose/melibiose transport system permease protein